MDTFNHSMFVNSFDNLQPIMWDPMSNTQMMNNYNEMFPRTNSEFYGSADSNSSNAPSPSSSTSSPVDSSRRSSKLVAELRTAVPDKVERRREQNRQSQRAYRDRKEKHQRELEGQVAQWKEKHNKLAESYANQTKEVTQLKSQIEDLNSQILSLQSGMPDMWPQIEQSPPDFDLVPWGSHES